MSNFIHNANQLFNFLFDSIIRTSRQHGCRIQELFYNLSKSFRNILDFSESIFPPSSPFNIIVSIQLAQHSASSIYPFLYIGCNVSETRETFSWTFRVEDSRM